MWSISCILYTLLVGKPPFETQTLKDTYSRIKKNEYHIPSRIGPLARNLIQRLLQHEPASRPSVDEILRDDFMTMGFLPSRLPVSCLTMAPRFEPFFAERATTKLFNSSLLWASSHLLLQVRHEDERLVDSPPHPTHGGELTAWKWSANVGEERQPQGWCRSSQ